MLTPIVNDNENLSFIRNKSLHVFVPNKFNNNCINNDDTSVNCYIKVIMMEPQLLSFYFYYIYMTNTFINTLVKFFNLFHSKCVYPVS